MGDAGSWHSYILIDETPHTLAVYLVQGRDKGPSIPHVLEKSDRSLNFTVNSSIGAMQVGVVFVVQTSICNTEPHRAT